MGEHGAPLGRRTVEHQALSLRRASMLRTTAIGLVSALALCVSLASPAGAMDGQMGGHMGGGAIHGADAGRGSMMAIRSDSSSGRFAQHDMGRMRMGGDRDHD